MEAMSVLTELCEASLVIRQEVVRQLLEKTNDPKPSGAKSPTGLITIVGMRPVEYDELLRPAMAWATRGKETITITAIKNHYSIPFERAARFIDYMEQEGYLSEPTRRNGPRKVLKAYFK